VRATPADETGQRRGTLDRLAAGAETIELGHPLEIGVPRYPVHPPFMYSLTCRHGERLVVLEGQDDEISGASDTFAMGTHTGTHIDSLTHCAVGGRLFDGTDALAPGVQDDARGIRTPHRGSIRPIVAPGVLLDFPALFGSAQVPADYAITPDEIERAVEAQSVTIEAGDVVLMRTGWDLLWGDAERYLALPLPGPTGDAARWLAARGIAATGSDTMPYEQAPAPVPLEVHAELLVNAGIFIMETLNLAELARRRIHRFLFVALPLRIEGGTGSPINPVAIVEANDASSGLNPDSGGSQ
jgi:kynurenine formamidase